MNTPCSRLSVWSVPGRLVQTVIGCYGPAAGVVNDGGYQSTVLFSMLPLCVQHRLYKRIGFWKHAWSRPCAFDQALDQLLAKNRSYKWVAQHKQMTESMGSSM